MRIRWARVSGAGIGAIGGLVLLAPGVVSAHIEPEPGAVEAGTEATVGFIVEHGCDGSPTVEFRFQVPAEVTDAGPVAKDGWTTSVEDGVVSFRGGSLDPETTDSFEIAFTAPSVPGTIYFPVVQRCEVGETAWIEIPADGGEEPDLPAPAVEVTDGPPPSEAAADGDESANEGHHSDSPEESAVDAEDGSSDGDDGVNGGLVGAGVGAVVIVGGTALFVRRRRDTTG